MLETYDVERQPTVVWNDIALDELCDPARRRRRNRKDRRPMPGEPPIPDALVQQTHDRLVMCHRLGVDRLAAVHRLCIVHKER